MLIAIGRPGGPVRMYIEIDAPGQDAGNMLPDEVAIEVDNRIMNANISDDGTVTVGGGAQ